MTDFHLEPKEAKDKISTELAGKHPEPFIVPCQELKLQLKIHVMFLEYFLKTDVFISS